MNSIEKRTGRPLVSIVGLIFLLVHVLAHVDAKEFLTPEEIEKVQNAREIGARVGVYLEAASLRLQSAENRLAGKESEPGDPLEFATPQEMIDAYYRIIRSIMFNVEEAFERPDTDPESLSQALKNLKKGGEKAAKDLNVLRKLCEEKRDAEAWNAVAECTKITSAAVEGAKLGISKLDGKKGRGRTREN